VILLAVRLPHGRNTLFAARGWCYLSFVLRAVLIAVALMFAATSLPDAEAGRKKPAASSKSKTAKKPTVKKAPAKKRVAKKTAKKPKKKRRSVENAEPRRPLP
jgi:hypothetical protein